MKALFWVAAITALLVVTSTAQAEPPTFELMGFPITPGSELRAFTSWLGKRSYKARLERLGLARLQEIARENGKKGGRPKGSGKKQAKKGGK